MRRGMCSVCDREYALTAKGVMRDHWKPAAQRVQYDWRCSGVGQEPKWIVADPIAEAIKAAESRGYQKAIQDLRNAVKISSAPGAKYWADYLESIANEASC